jgi:hypothetical protein
LALLLGDPARLEEWSRDFGVHLDETPATVQRLDDALDLALGRERHGGYPSGPRTATWGTDVGLILGTVLVRNLPGARWIVWPNGHPVVRLASGREVDVIDAGRRRVSARGPRLAEVYGEASGPARRRGGPDPHRGIP